MSGGWVLSPSRVSSQESSMSGTSMFSTRGFRSDTVVKKLGKEFKKILKISKE